MFHTQYRLPLGKSTTSLVVRAVHHIDQDAPTSRNRLVNQYRAREIYFKARDHKQKPAAKHSVIYGLPLTLNEHRPVWEAEQRAGQINRQSLCETCSPRIIFGSKLNDNASLCLNRHLHNGRPGVKSLSLDHFPTVGTVLPILPRGARQGKAATFRQSMEKAVSNSRKKIQEVVDLRYLLAQISLEISQPYNNYGHIGLRGASSPK
jgi:hypothetical protein